MICHRHLADRLSFIDLTTVSLLLFLVDYRIKSTGTLIHPKASFGSALELSRSPRPRVFCQHNLLLRITIKWRRIDIESDDKSFGRCRESDLCMNGPRTQNWHDELGQNSQVCSEQQKRRPPAEFRPGRPSPWFGRTIGFRRTLLSAIWSSASLGRCGLAPNDGWRVFPTIPTVTTVIGRL